MTSFRSLIVAATLWGAATSLCLAAAKPPLDDKAVAEVVNRLTSSLHNEYPRPEIADIYQRALTKTLRSGAYHGLSACDLAAHLSADLQKAHADRHLRVWCGGQAGAHRPAGDRLGHGLESVALYPDLSLAAITMPGPWEIDDASFETVTHAMALAADADNVVLDLRGNPGGHGEIGHFIASYFLPPGTPPIFERGLYHPPRPPEIAKTLPYVPGRRLTDTRLFILINAGTGSAAEGFTFGMQQMHRATIVGQTSAGAGIAAHDQNLGQGLTMSLPFKLIVAPDSDLSWEGRGVIPDRMTEPDKEYDAVAEIIREEAVKRDGPVFTAAPAPVTAEPPAPAEDTTPHWEKCEEKQVADDGKSLSLINRCDRPVTVQYDNGDHPEMVYQQDLAPGDRIDARLPARQWWVVAVCPQGYFSTLPLNAANHEAIETSHYACTRPGTNE